MLYRFGNTWHYRFHFSMSSGRSYTSRWRELTDNPRSDHDKRHTERQRAWMYAWRDVDSDAHWVQIPDSQMGSGRINDSQVELIQLELLEGELEETRGQISQAIY
ncbi:hypothetical protein GCM10009772_54960 [Pseudonocardia alni subsp. carboxydivorans]